MKYREGDYNMDAALLVRKLRGLIQTQKGSNERLFILNLLCLDLVLER